jgi:hypothetical protein
LGSLGRKIEERDSCLGNNKWGFQEVGFKKFRNSCLEISSRNFNRDIEKKCKNYIRVMSFKTHFLEE